MNVEIYYLPRVGKDHPDFETIRMLRHKFSVGDKERVSKGDFETYWEKVGEDTVESISEVFARWNAGSGNESKAFATRECTDCGDTFVGPNPSDFEWRNTLADEHEEETGHDVDWGTRSLSVGDIVVDADTGTAHLCAPIGWTELDFEADTE